MYVCIHIAMQANICNKSAKTLTFKIINTTS